MAPAGERCIPASTVSRTAGQAGGGRQDAFSGTSVLVLLRFESRRAGAPSPSHGPRWKCMKLPSMDFFFQIKEFAVLSPDCVWMADSLSSEHRTKPCRGPWRSGRVADQGVTFLALVTHLHPTSRQPQAGLCSIQNNRAAIVNCDDSHSLKMHYFKASPPPL